ncbi:hypothetical protein COLO4_04371 [Corchorus olitorius]|uniref:Uncharacterized protein n=1 Tax=Corchorus olitorius TaxID=93759 RepID=A0A1R3KUD2_9ROSI|nr:hypothetical protein COLO4_04371 [Corchorus olitorius]
MPPLQPVEEAPEVVDEDIHDRKFSSGGCCFWIPCRSAVSSIWWERIAADESAGSTNTSHSERWWTRGWKKVREWSELVAGPKWKTFIRRFKKNHRTGYGGTKFHYDAMSYALNFDEGPGQNGHFDEDFMYRNFSSRYASLPVSAKSSMDLGKDAPFFT